MPQPSSENSETTSKPKQHLRITRTVTYTKVVTINKWSYPDKTPIQAKGFEEVRHTGNEAMFDGVIYEFSDDIKFVERKDLTITTEVSIEDA